MFLQRLFTIIVLVCLGMAPATEALAGRDKTYTRTIENYEVPDVTLINQDGKRIEARKLFACDKPVIVDFIYTSCTTICPVLSVNFINFQKTIIEEAGSAQLISISIDPEFDSPKEMKAYLKRYQAKPGWEFLTGSRSDIDRLLKVFKVYTGDKMSHPPVILLRSPTDKRWVRLYGLIGTTELLVEYEKVRK